MPEISVIVPAYNAEKTIENSVLSVLDGTFHDVEVIVVDDGSADGTAEKVREIIKTDPRVRLFTKQNGGVSSARNAGIASAGGKYIMFLDADDEYSRDMCARLSQSIALNNSDIAVCGYNEIYSEKSVAHFCPAKGVSDGVHQIFENFIKPVAFSGTNGFMGTVCTSLFKKSIIDENNITFDENICFAEDLLFLTQYLLFCKRMSVVDEALYNYMLGGGSATKNYSADFYSSSCALEKRLDGLMSGSGTEYTREMRANRAVGSVIALLVNEARKNNPSGFFTQLKKAAGMGRQYRDTLKSYKPEQKTLKIKRLIAVSPVLSMLFFTVRRIQRAMGVYF